MTEVAKVREALEGLRHHSTAGNDAWRTMPGMDVLFGLADAFVAHGLKACEEYETTITGPWRIDLLAAILRDAGLLEEGR